MGAWACGISWSLPATPFANDGSYQFRYWESLGTVKVDDKLDRGNQGATNHLQGLLWLANDLSRWALTPDAFAGWRTLGFFA